MFSSSECVISRVLSCFYLLQGRCLFSVLSVLRLEDMLSTVISPVLAWFNAMMFFLRFEAFQFL